MPGQLFPVGFSDLDEVTEWLDGILPSGRGDLEVDDLSMVLNWCFTAALDEGVPLPIDAGGRPYQVDLFAGVVGQPTRNTTVDVPKAKLEQRINTIDLEDMFSRSRITSFYGRAGFAGKVGILVASLTTKLGGGASKGKGRAWGGSTAAGRYMYLKPDDVLGQLDLPVIWSARVTDVRTGRSRDPLVWTDAGGGPRRAMVELWVSQHLMPTGCAQPPRDHRQR